MHARVAAVFFLTLFSIAAMAQDPELQTPSDAFKEQTLRSSCYCIGCSLAEVEQLAAARCRFVRWGAYPFIGARPLSDAFSYAEELDATYNEFAAFVAQYKSQRADGVVEFVLPEIITERIEQVQLGELRDELEQLQIITPLPATFRFDYDLVKHPGKGDHVWNPDPDFDKSSVPSLVTAQGRLWAAYLAGRAILAGADAIGFGQPQLRTNSSDDLQRNVRTIRRLRGKLGIPASRPALLFGASATEHITKGANWENLKLFIDYAKVQVDIDSYEVINNQRSVNPAPPSSTRVPCQLLGDGTLNSELLPTNTSAQLRYLCMIATNQSDRKTGADAPQRNSFNNSNPYGLRLLMELDGVQKCISGGERVWYYLPDPPLTSTCYQQVRHGLPTTMYFLSGPAAARSKFIEYMYELAKHLSTVKPYRVYFPLPIRVDQNEMPFVLEQKPCSPAPCTTKCSDMNWARPTQVKLIRACPTDDPNDPGRLCGLNRRQYVARICPGDMETIKRLLPQ